MDLRGIEQFVRKAMLTRAAYAAADYIAVGRADHQPTGDLEQPPPGIGLDPTP